jgi:dipeptidyl aminopeptidase/acylaminoacyl peptidase
VFVLTSFQPGPPAESRAPDGTLLRQPAVEAAAAPLNPGGTPVCPLWLPRLSPDARRLVVVRLRPTGPDSHPWTRHDVWLFDLDAKDGPTEPLLADLRCPSAVWSPDGSKLYGSQVDPAKAKDPRQKGKSIPMVSWVCDLATKARMSLAVPPGHAIADVSPDGKTLLTVVADSEDMRPASYLVPLDTLKPRPLTDRPFRGMRFSPDGRWVLGTRPGKDGDDPPPLALGVVAVADGAERRFLLPDGASWVRSACWSPDGRRVAYLWDETFPPAPGAPARPGQAPADRFAGRLTVADADGRNAKTIVRREAGVDITGLDWR